MSKILIFGNSGSGKSTLAKQLCCDKDLAHLDLDTIAWQATTLPKRRALPESENELTAFVYANKSWVIEGCYTDLLELASPYSNEIIFLNLPVQLCIANAKNRPWEPHKYPSKQAQDANLKMLITWIEDYSNRNDTFSERAHKHFYAEYPGIKTEFLSNERVS